MALYIDANKTIVAVYYENPSIKWAYDLTNRKNIPLDYEYFNYEEVMDLGNGDVDLCDDNIMALYCNNELIGAVNLFNMRRTIQFVNILSNKKVQSFAILMIGAILTYAGENIEFIFPIRPYDSMRYILSMLRTKRVNYEKAMEIDELIDIEDYNSCHEEIPTIFVGSKMFWNNTPYSEQLVNMQRLIVPDKFKDIISKSTLPHMLPSVPPIEIYQHVKSEEFNKFREKYNNYFERPPSIVKLEKDWKVKAFDYDSIVKAIKHPDTAKMLVRTLETKIDSPLWWAIEYDRFLSAYFVAHLHALHLGSKDNIYVIETEMHYHYYSIGDPRDPTSVLYDPREAVYKAYGFKGIDKLFEYSILDVIKLSDFKP
jgi:hypothetical protein